MPEIPPPSHAPRHSLGGLGYPDHASFRVPSHTVIHSGHLAGLGYVGFVTAPSATAVAATLLTSVGTTPVPRVGHGRTSHPHMEMVAGVFPPTQISDDLAPPLAADAEKDGGDQRRTTKPAPPRQAAKQAPARGAKRSRGRGA
jgi:hypothetical protein